MPIPLRVTSVKIADRWPKNIIIHHTAEHNYGLTARLDTVKFQTGKFEYGFYRKKKLLVTPYHIIVERVDNDFYPIISRPLFTEIVWDDLEDKYKSSVHIAVYGDFDNDIPMTRLYHIMAFKVLFPIMTMFRIPEDHILLHNEISNNPEETCPGEFFDKRKLVSAVRKFRRFKSIRRV